MAFAQRVDELLKDAREHFMVQLAARHYISHSETYDMLFGKGNVNLPLYLTGSVMDPLVERREVLSFEYFDDKEQESLGQSSGSYWVLPKDVDILKEDMNRKGGILKKDRLNDPDNKH